MQFDLVLKNGQVVTPRETFRADIGVRAGKIAAIGDLKGAQASETYDASGQYIFPGFIDEHVHSRDPGSTHKEDFAHSTRAAAAGGITTLLEMPNSIPPVVDAPSFHSRVAELAPKAFIDFGLWGMVLGDHNTKDLPDLHAAGVIGFKLFWGYALNRETLSLVYNFNPGDDVVMPPDDGQIFDAFCAVGLTGRPVAIHAENAAIINRLTAREKAAGNKDYAAILRSRPSYTEALIAETGIRIAAAAGAHLHILHIAAGEVVDLVTAARARGQAVTGETCPHYLTLTDADYPHLGNAMKIYPLVRQQHHQDRLWLGLQRGEIQTIGSDHAPHTPEEKSQGDIWSAPAGACGLQSMAPLMLDAVAQGKITAGQVAALLSENPARLFGLYGKKGVIAPGADADFTVVDLSRVHTLRNEDLVSKNRVSPFDGRTVQGMPVAAFVRGSQVMADGVPLGQARGQLVKPVAPSQSAW